MREVKVKVADGGRIVIPAEYRKALGIHVGDEVLLRLQDNEMRVTTRLQAIHHAQELVRRYTSSGQSLVDELLAERRLEGANE